MPTPSQPAPRRKLNVKKGDTVQVITGKDRGVKGKVILTLPAAERVLVEGVNRVKKHTRVGTNQRGAQTGGIVTQEAPVHISNVMVVCPSCDKPSRLGHRKDTVEKRRADGTTYESQRSVRVCKRCGEDV